MSATAAAPAHRVPDRAPLVSVVTPTFQRLAMLRQALDSAVAQEFRDFELIVSDNEVSPEVRRLVASYGDPRLRYRDNGVNIGALANAIAALREARGRYVTLLHDDDVWEPTFLAELVRPLEEDPGLVLAFSDHHIMTPDGEIDVAATEVSSAIWRRADLEPGVHRPFVQQALIDRSVPIAMGSLMRRDAVDWEDFPTEIGTIYDIWLAYQLCRGGAGAYYVPRRLTRYRQHAGAITSQTRYDRQFAYCYGRFVADPRLASHRRPLRREEAGFQCGLALSLLAGDGSRSQARRLLLQSVLGRPTLRALVGLSMTVLPRGTVTAVRSAASHLPGRSVVRA